MFVYIYLRDRKNDKSIVVIVKKILFILRNYKNKPKKQSKTFKKL